MRYFLLYNLVNCDYNLIKKTRRKIYVEKNKSFSDVNGINNDFISSWMQWKVWNKCCRRS